MPPVFNHRLVASARLDLGLTQEQAAAAAGVDVRTYRRYESGEVNDPVEGFSVRHPSRRRIVQRLARELGIAESELLIEAAATSADPPRDRDPPRGLAPCFAHPLPRARHFVGREGELARLAAWIAEEKPEARVLAIVALGGAGKTSLVERCLARLGDAPREGGVLVWSFYDDPRAEALCDRAIAYFSRAESIHADRGRERLDALAAALGDGPHLLVLDGLETMQGTGRGQTTLGRVEDPLLRRLLASAARGIGRTRLLVTTRLPLVDLAAWEGSGLTTLRLGALSEAEGLDLLARWGLAGAANDLAPLVDRAGGHALSLSVMGSYAGAFLGGDPARARAIALEPAARDDPEARRLLSVLAAYAAALAPEERDLVARLALFPAGVEIEVLAAIARAGGAVAGALAGLDADHLRPLLARLGRLGLASRSGDRFTTHPFLADYFLSLLGAPAQEIHAATRATFAARLDAHSAGPADLSRLDAYEALLLSTLRAGHVDEAADLYLRRVGGYPNLGLRLGEMSRGLRLTAAFAEGGDPARLSRDLAPHRRARLAYELGLYAGALGDLDRAARAYRAHNAIMGEAGALLHVSTGLRTLAYTERLRGALGDALELVSTAAEVAEGGGSRPDQVRAIALRASILHDLGRVTEAARGFAEARALGDAPFARRELWEAEHLLDLGRFEALRAETEKNLEVCRELGWEGHAAHAHTLLGRAALPGDPRAARAHLEAAQRWTAATGEVEVMLRCLELEAQIALSEGRFPEAAGAAQAGMDLAGSMGFALFDMRFTNLGAAAIAAAGRGSSEEARGAAQAAVAKARGIAGYAWGVLGALDLAGMTDEAAGLREQLQNPPRVI